jgi:hypothetical protein
MLPDLQYPLLSHLLYGVICAYPRRSKLVLVFIVTNSLMLPLSFSMTSYHYHLATQIGQHLVPLECDISLERRFFLLEFLMANKESSQLLSKLM